MAGKTKNKSTAKAKHAAQRKKSKPAKKTNPRKRSRPRLSASSAKEKTAEALAVLGPDRLKDLYSVMVKCRALAENIQKAHSAPARDMNSEIAGLEAMLVGAGAHLQAQDNVVLEHNRLMAGLVRGAPLQEIFSKLKAFSNRNRNDGKRESISQGKDASASKVTVDALLAQAEEVKSQRGMTVLFCTEHPVTLAGQDALAVAAERKLPIVCLVENRSELESSVPQADASEQTFYPRIAVDGNDLVAIFRVAQEATRRAREGHGPALIDCLFSSAIPVAVDPILFMEQYLQQRKLWSGAWARKISDDFKREMKETLASTHEHSMADSHLVRVYSLVRSRP